MASKSSYEELTLVTDTQDEMDEAVATRLAEGYEEVRRVRRPSGEVTSTLRRAALT
jgi:hypothetical protein